MVRHRQFAIGLITMVAGFTVTAIGIVFPSGHPVVALGWLLVAPSLASLCGAIFVFLSLVRSTERERLLTPAFRMIALPSAAGLALAIGVGVAGIVSQVPDSLEGLNGNFVASPAPALSAFILDGLGLSTGLVIGALDALVWWCLRTRRANARSQAPA